MPKPSAKTNTGVNTENEISFYLSASLLETAFTSVEIESMTAPAPDDEEHLIEEVGFFEQEYVTEEKCWAEKEALSYIAGYIAFKVKDRTLGTITK